MRRRSFWKLYPLITQQRGLKVDTEADNHRLQITLRLAIRTTTCLMMTMKVCAKIVFYIDKGNLHATDILARLSLYFLTDPSVSFIPLLKPLLTPETIPNTLVVILLDWSQPWLWLRQLRDWVRLLRTVLVSLDKRCKQKMEELMINWRDRGRGAISLDVGGNTTTDGDITLPLGPGEWDEALGLPLCIVCQNVRPIFRCYVSVRR